MKFGIYSITMPEYNLEETVELVKSIGFSGIEWRIDKLSPKEKVQNYKHHRRYWSNNYSTVNIDNVVSDLSRAKDLCDAQGITVCSVTYNKEVSDYDGIVLGMKAISKIGCPMMRVDIPVYDGTKNYNDLLRDTKKHLERLMKPAADYGVKLLLEIHMDTIIPSASAVYRMISDFDPKYIGVIYDPGNMVLEGYEQYKMGLEILGDYLAHVHVKNTRWIQPKGDEGWTWEFCPMEKGLADIKNLLNILKDFGYDGWVSVEDFSNEDETETKLRKVFNMLDPIISCK